MQMEDSSVGPIGECENSVSNAVFGEFQGLSDCSSEDNDNDEPKLKYSRLLRDLKTIMVTDAISTVKVHYKVGSLTYANAPRERFTAISPTPFSISAWELIWAACTCSITPAS